MIAKYDIDPDGLYFDAALDETAIAGDMNGNNRLEAEKLKSNLYLCIGDEAQSIFKARKPAVSIKTERHHKFQTRCRTFSNKSEMLHTSEDCFTEGNKKITKHLRKFMQN